MLTTEQVMALIIFVCMFIFIIFDKIERQYVTLFAALLTIIVTFGICMRSPSAIMRALNIQHFNEVSFWFSKKGSESKMSENMRTYRPLTLPYWYFYPTYR